MARGYFRVLIAIGLGLAVAGCGLVETSAPAATPTDFGGIAARLASKGIDIRNAVSGDAGCSDRDLIPTAVGFDASGVDQPTPVRIHLFIFADEAAFERRRDQLPGCARSFVTDPQTYEEVEESPYIAAGQGPWAAGFEAALRAALASGAQPSG
ncbi:MAG: hypothetical protein ACJ77N_15700 [Chloroflexota bacterium]